ncbi:HipA N-terminal domain-containing protein [Halomonas sp. KO116]|uniref:HipA N-terminal domain-containing protein n=1 Tax=Halomonas sp. KO116 TaxID=1504981 RepID=UPI0004E2BBA8|nr:HipA N-terminal domain-containing protein [Halomonas sp. KO116]
MTDHSEALDLFWGKLHIGRLHNTRPLRFEYTHEWLTNSQANSLSPRLPLTQQQHSGDSVLAYFENLLPEGELRRYIELRHHTTTIFGLLRSIGGDTASGYTLLPQGEIPQPASYRETHWKAINDFLHNESQGELTGQLAPQARI